MALARAGANPNHISVVSMVAAVAAGMSLYLGTHASSTALRVALPLLAVVFIQLRLLCNLLDGLVAIEGGRQRKSGEVFNDFPDRISDLVIFVGAGHAISAVPYGVEVGWMAGMLAVTTAYVRLLGGAMGLTQSFIGPMAKQRRMTMVTVACVGQAIEAGFGAPSRVMPIALVVVIIGSAVTVCRRLAHVVREAEQR